MLSVYRCCHAAAIGVQYTRISVQSGAAIRNLHVTIVYICILGSDESSRKLHA